MKTGYCALCRRKGKLHESHFLPKGIYRLLRDSKTKNRNPVLMSPRLATQKSHQMIQSLLCSDCENRFSNGGESYVIPLLKKNDFPLLDRMNIALPLDVTRDSAAFLCKSARLDGEKIAYFGLSILWRAAVQPWRAFDSSMTSLTIDAIYMESIRRYLIGEIPLPDNMAVIATVATDFISQNICTVPYRVSNNPMLVVYSFICRGLCFHFILGENQPAAMRAISCGGQDPQMIFARDCSDNVWPAVERMMTTTTSKVQLAEAAKHYLLEAPVLPRSSGMIMKSRLVSLNLDMRTAPHNPIALPPNPRYTQTSPR